MGGAEAFPYPPDDPVHVRSMAATLGTLRTSLDRSYRRVHTHWATLSDRWLGVAGPRATGEILNLGSALQLSAGGLDGLDVAARTYAQVIETARVAIDHLRTSYDQIDFTADTNMADDRALSRLVDRYQDVLEEVRAAGKRLGGRLLQAAGTWSPAPASANPGLARLKALEQLRFMAPDDGPAITRLPGLVLIDTGSGNDVVTVQIDPATGEVVVTVNGVEHRFTAAEANGLVIRTGRGKDVVEVAAGTRIGFTILTESDDDRVVGGSGDDLISSGYGNDDVNGGRGSDAVDLGEGNDRYRDAPTPGWLGALFTPLLGPGGNDAVAGSGGDDEIRTGEGDDHVDGGSGNDRVDTGRGDDTVDGGQGDDRIYGGDGDDKVRGGGGKDYLEGGAGNDRIDGGTGDDLVSGGRGDDVLDGGSGNDVVNTGAGRDSVTDIAGSNTVYAKAGDIVTGNGTTTRVTIEIAEIPRNITTEGSPEFVDHAQADLDLLAASPTGQKMLARLGSGPGTVVIRELTPEQAKTAAGLAWGEAGDRRIAAYNPDGYGINVLYHELNHTDAGMHNVGVPGWYAGGDARDMPKGLDTNHDGLVTFSELDTNRDGRFDAKDMDRNHDGKVDGDDGWIGNVERQAVGLGVDPDTNPDTPDVPASTVVDQPEGLDTNDLNRELNIPRQDHYHW